MLEGTKKNIVWETNTEPPKNYVWVKSDGIGYEWDDILREWVISQNIRSGQPEIEEKDVNFRDYDGKIVASYSASDFASLQALPSNPTHTGLISQGWNWSLSDAKALVASTGKLEIGQMYAADNPDGKTRFYITIDDFARPTMSLYFKPSSNGSVMIDWGDGTVEPTTGNNYATFTHDYQSLGDFVITLEVLSGELGLSFSSTYNILGSSTDRQYNYSRLKRVILGTGIGDSEWAYTFYNCYNLESVQISNGVPKIGIYVFGNCYSLKKITLPSSITTIENSAFTACYSLESLTVPNNVTTIGTSLNSCYSLSSVSLPNSLTTLSGFTNDYALRSLVLPNSLTRVGNGTFRNMYRLSTIKLPSTLINLTDQLFSGCSCLEKVEIPEGVQTIGPTVFSSCASLKSITFPSTVLAMAGNVIAGSTGIKTITMLSQNPPSIVAATFSGRGSDLLIYVPAGRGQAYRSATNWSSLSSIIVELPSEWN